MAKSDRETLISRSKACDPAECNDVAIQAMRDLEEDLYAQADVANALRDRSAFSSATMIYDEILEHNPNAYFIHYEKSFLYLLCGQHVDAAHQLDKLLKISSGDDRANLLSARVLFGLGVYREAHIRLKQALNASQGERFALHDFGQFIKNYPLGWSLYQTLKLESDECYYDVDHVSRMIEEAITHRSPFSFVRLGDGEGAFIEVSSEDSQKYSSLYEYNRLDRSRVWFNGEVNIETSGFSKTAKGIHSAIKNADLLGIPYTGWMQHEYRILSITGISTLVNIIRFIHEIRTDQQKLCVQTMHWELNSRGFFNRVLAQQTEIGLIACHPQLPSLLSARFGVKDIEFYKLPGEKAMSDHLSPDALQGRHYPDVFDGVMSAISRPLKGKLFLVAGGLLGKIYCQRIKECGGIALDLGSLVDGWVGAETRGPLGQQHVL